MKLFLIRLAFLFGFFSINSTQASVEAFEAFYENTSTLQASFEQKIIDENGETLDMSSGVFYLSRPGKFRWSYDSVDPEFEHGTEFVADGETIFNYDPDSNIVTKYGFVSALESVPTLVLTQSIESIDHHFDIRDLGKIDGVDSVALKPKGEEADYQPLVLGFSGDKLSSIEFTDSSGVNNYFLLTNIKNNPKLSKKLFEFVIPDGVDVQGN